MLGSRIPQAPLELSEEGTEPGRKALPASEVQPHPPIARELVNLHDHRHLDCVDGKAFLKVFHAAVFTDMHFPPQEPVNY